MRTRWLGATGVRVPEIAVEGDDVEAPDDQHIRIGESDIEALVLEKIDDLDVLHEAHLRGTPVVVRASGAQEVAAALEHPEVACVLVPPGRGDLKELDLRRLKYG
ncbi:MAG TPA: hypothetical protein VES61_05500 [Gaiellaceae bacterium]|nr:hypothetical protein [Gaiellaceae bacterium]